MKQEVVVITGASSGVGRATAREFAKNNAAVALLARGSKGLEGAKKEVEDAGGKGLIVPVDVSDPQALEKAAQKVEETLGPIDIWINCAMTTVFAEFTDIKPEEFRRVTEVTYLGYAFGTYTALKRMTARNKGTIVQVGSALAYRSIPLQSGYCGAKHAIRGFTDSIRCELMHHKSNIVLTMVHLPAVNTPQFDWCKNKMPHKSQPVPPIYQPELIAKHIFWAAHHKRREILLGLNTWIIVWGNKFLPGLGDLYLAKTGFSSQQYNGPDNPNKPDNLFKPVDSNPGSRGSFTPREKEKSKQMNFTTWPGYPYYGGIVAGFLLLSMLKVLIRKKI